MRAAVCELYVFHSAPTELCCTVLTKNRPHTVRELRVGRQLTYVGRLKSVLALPLQPLIALIGGHSRAR